MLLTRLRPAFRATIRFENTRSSYWYTKEGRRRWHANDAEWGLARDQQVAAERKVKEEDRAQYPDARYVHVKFDVQFWMDMQSNDYSPSRNTSQEASAKRASKAFSLWVQNLNPSFWTGGRARVDRGNTAKEQDAILNTAFTFAQEYAECNRVAFATNLRPHTKDRWKADVSFDCQKTNGQLPEQQLESFLKFVNEVPAIRGVKIPREQPELMDHWPERTNVYVELHDPDAAGNNGLKDQVKEQVSRIIDGIQPQPSSLCDKYEVLPIGDITVAGESMDKSPATMSRIQLRTFCHDVRQIKGVKSCPKRVQKYSGQMSQYLLKPSEIKAKAVEAPPAEEP